MTDTPYRPYIQQKCELPAIKTARIGLLDLRRRTVLYFLLDTRQAPGEPFDNILQRADHVRDPLFRVIDPSPHGITHDVAIHFRGS